MWVVDNKKRPILPKDEEAGIMISAFQSFEFGFRYPLTNEELERVNEKRIGQKYFDEEASNVKKGK